jgi:hypothetical protein
MRRFCSAPAPTAPSLHARGPLPCIRTRLRKRIESAVGPASRRSCFDLCIGGGSSSCLAALWLLRARHAQPSPSLRSFSFRFATPHSHFRFREDRGLHVLGSCLSLLSALSCHAAAPPHTCAYAFPHREPRALACVDRPATHRRSLRRGSASLAPRHIRSSACCDVIQAEVRSHWGRALRGRPR